MKKLKTGIIGCGKVADMHANAYKELDQSDFVAVCDVNIDNTKYFIEKYGVKAYSNVATMIKEEGLDAVSVCTPHPIHADVTCQALSCGCNVITEKPLASSLVDCDRMMDTAKANNVQLATMVQRRFYPPAQRIKNAIEKGELGGKPIIGLVQMIGWRDEAYYKSNSWRGTWKGEGGGVLVNQAVHQLDMLLWFMDSDVDTVYGVWKNYNHPYIEVEDSAIATILFKNGAMASIITTNSVNPALYGSVHVFGPNGVAAGVQTDGSQMFIAGMTTIEYSPYNDIWTVPGYPTIEEKKAADEKEFFQEDPTMHYHKVAINDFLNAINGGKKPMADGLAGRQAVELFQAIYECTRTGMPVKFPIK